MNEREKKSEGIYSLKEASSRRKQPSHTIPPTGNMNEYIYPVGLQRRSGRKDSFHRVMSVASRQSWADLSEIPDDQQPPKGS